MTGKAEVSRDVRWDRSFLGVLLLVCAGSAIAALPTRLVQPGWVVAFVLPAALYAMLGTGWRQLLVAGLCQLVVAAVAYAWLGVLRLEAALALSLLPPLTFFTIRRQPHDTGLSLFLSFCFLLIGTMLTHGQSDWRLLVFLCAGGLAMQVEASTRASLVRHAHRTAPAPGWRLGASRTQITTLMLLVGSLLYLCMGALPRSGPESVANLKARRSVSNHRSVGLSHEFDLTGAQGRPLRIEADRMLLATAGDLRRVPSDLYLRMTHFDKAGTERWSTDMPRTKYERAGARGHVIEAPLPRRRMRSLSINLEQPMSGGELFVPPGLHRIRGVELLELHRATGWCRAPKPDDNRDYWVEYQRLNGLERQARLQDRQDPHLVALPRTFTSSQELEQLVASFTRGLTRRSTPVQRARRIAAGLQSRCRYALREPAGGQSDTLHRFLFGSREGYCMHFATALAVMLRLQHIPCRIAVGFYGGEPNGNDPFEVSRVFGAHHAHAWVEIPVELGRRKTWLVVDGTPPADRTLPGWPAATTRIGTVEQPKRPAEASACMLAAFTPLLDAPLGFLDSPSDYPHTLALLGILVAICVLWSGVLFLREQRDQQPAARDKKLSGDSHRARQLLMQILRALNRYPRPYNSTLENYLERLDAAQVPVDLDALARGFETYQEIRFGCRKLEGKRLHAMQAALTSVKRTGS